MSLGSRTKDPADSRNYGIDWSDWLEAENNDTISDSSWNGGGLTIVANTNTTTSAVAQVSGGSVGHAYTVANTITTAAGQIRRVSFQLNVELQ